ncbi:hypothetical protein GCM10023091_08460 [Ravibacter arvi]|uniref:Uncharacterized protein n=1 Tax=Ravibacter arvi TaxID=2051041 RepID=A0ABP8LQ86_9BACT
MNASGKNNTPRILEEKKVKLGRKPQNKDDLDSRERTEQQVRGDKISHNVKEKRNDKNKK